MFDLTLTEIFVTVMSVSIVAIVLPTYYRWLHDNWRKTRTRHVIAKRFIGTETIKTSGVTAPWVIDTVGNKSLKTLQAAPYIQVVVLYESK